MSSMFNYIASFFTYYGSFGRTAPVEDVSKLKTLVKNKAIFVITEDEVQKTLKNLRHVTILPKVIEDTRPEILKEIERRYIEKMEVNS